MPTFDMRAVPDLPVPLEVLHVLHVRARGLGIRLLVIGAAARDLVVHGPTKAQSPRSTDDVDVAIAVDRAGFEAYTRGWERVRASERKFLIHGIEVDVIPFGPLESDRKITLNDDHVLDVNGLAEAMETAVTVLLPEGLEVDVASLPGQAALKVLAWRDRHNANPKDARDLREILDAAWSDPHDDEVWDDAKAMEWADHDIILAAAYRVGRLAAEPFTPDDGRHVLNVLEDEQAADRLARQMGGGSAAARQVLAFAAGFRGDLTGESRT